MNKVISREYVEKNYVHKDKLKALLEKIHISDIEPWSFYQISGDILFELEKLTEETKDVNK